MSELNDKLQKSLLFTQGALLQAIVATHPEPELVKQAFLDQTNQLITNLAESESELKELVRLHTSNFLKHFPT